MPIVIGMESDFSARGIGIVLFATWLEKILQIFLHTNAKKFETVE